VAFGLLALSRATGDSAYLPIGIDLAVLSVGIGLVMAPATEAVMGALPPARAGIGSAVNDATREVGGALGIALFGSITASTYTHQVSQALKGTPTPAAAADAVEHSIGGAMVVANQVGGRSGAALARIAQHAFVDGFSISLAVAAGLVFVGAVVIGFSLPAHAEAEVVAEDEVVAADLSVADAPA
jgi:hypothetical protein